MVIVASVITVSDNGLAFTAIAEIAGPFWSGRALGTQNTSQLLTAGVAPPVFGALIGVAGYAAAFAVCALFPLIAIPLVPVDADPLIGERGSSGASDAFEVLCASRQGSRKLSSRACRDALCHCRFHAHHGSMSGREPLAPAEVSSRACATTRRPVGVPDETGAPQTGQQFLHRLPRHKAESRQLGC